MELWKICLAGLVGTTLMTLFSKVCGWLLSKEFSEPKFLDAFLRPSSVNHSKLHLLGWLVHYLIGILFAFLIYGYCARYATDFSYLNGILLGPSLGLVGILGWKAMLSWKKKPPTMELPAFFIQLVFAHIVFAFGALFVLRSIDGQL